jgi:hypothetical protein
MKLFYKFFALIYTPLMLLRWRRYYLVFTGMGIGGRMYYRVVYDNGGSGMLPIKSLEDAMKKELDWNTCILLSWTKIPINWSLYVDKLHPSEITLKSSLSEIE